MLASISDTQRQDEHLHLLKTGYFVTHVLETSNRPTLSSTNYLLLPCIVECESAFPSTNRSKIDYSTIESTTTITERDCVQTMGGVLMLGAWIMYTFDEAAAFRRAQETADDEQETILAETEVQEPDEFHQQEEENVASPLTYEHRPVRRATTET
jgi:hypothetical protein